MDIAKLKRIFEFLEAKEGQNAPVKWKIINNVPLTEEELNVIGNLWFYGTTITSLPKGFKISGNLDISDTKIKSLPKGLEVGGHLDLSDTPITSLPEGLKVDGNLFLHFSKIKSLPKGLKLDGNLYLRGTPLSENYTNGDLRDMIKPDGFINGAIVS